MSSHFNYEIDERNLRLKLRDMALPQKEEAWIQFENFSNTHYSVNKSASLPSFNFNINRALILPFIFGGIIILFSLLLFNFISIKNVKPSEQNKELANKNIEEKKPLPVVIPQVKKETVKVDTSAQKKALKPVETPTVATEIIKPALITPSPAAKPVIADEKLEKWISTESGKIYSSPNIQSNVIGSVNEHQSYSALEETNYFIKISFGNEIGYIRKNFLRKNNGEKLKEANPIPEKRFKRRNRKAETLESIQAPLKTSSGEEKEPELK
ncbi:MAG: SH3 domain-containing protein [Bacteroidetes bacterium]|nr:SH3 domain-containing protein [Bacteroidota bacterium]